MFVTDRQTDRWTDRQTESTTKIIDSWARRGDQQLEKAVGLRNLHQARVTPPATAHVTSSIA